MDSGEQLFVSMYACRQLSPELLSTLLRPLPAFLAPPAVPPFAVCAALADRLPAGSGTVLVRVSGHRCLAYAIKYEYYSSVCPYVSKAHSHLLFYL